MSKFHLDRKAQEWKISLKELNEKLADAEIKWISENFDKEQWNGNHWQEAKDGHHPLLVKTGSLEQSIKNPIKEVSEHGYTLIVDNSYGIYHQKGTNTIPKRQFFPTSDDEEPEELKQIKKEIIDEHIKNIFEH